MKRQLKIPLFWKFTIAIVATVALFGTLNLYFINYAVYDLFEKEITQHGRITATSIAERSIVPIAYDDLATLDRIVSDQKKIDPTIAYIFIIDNNENLIAHTFEQNVPSDLLSVNKTRKSDSVYMVKIQPKKNHDSMIRDMAFPIMQGNLGVVRIGLYEENYIKSINKTTRIFLLMVLFFLLFGIIGAFFFSYIISTPLKRISDITKKIELGSSDIQNEDFDESLKRSDLVKWKNILNVKDEIDVLITSFGEMISRLKNTYAKLKRTQSSLFHSEKMASLGTLSAGIAHEINNPIAGIQNCIRRLQENPDKLKQNISYLEMIDEALRKIEKVVIGLLDYSKKTEMHFSNENLNRIIENVLVLTSYKLENSRIAIVKNFGNKSNMLNISANHLEQVVLNIVLNSIDAIEEKKLDNRDFPGEIKFDIKESPDSVYLEIADNGTGIATKHLNEIFDPFFTQKKTGTGTGLGLSVSYGIIEQHNGTISATINEKGGLTQVIRLPKS